MVFSKSWNICCKYRKCTSKSFGKIPHLEFNKTLSETQSVWEKELSKIKVEAPNKNKTIFYTALYHSLLAPYLYKDVNKEYLGFDKQTHIARSLITIQCCRCGIHFVLKIHY